MKLWHTWDLFLRSKKSVGILTIFIIFHFLHKILHHFSFCQNRSEIDSKLPMCTSKSFWLNDMCALMYTLLTLCITFWRFSIFIFANFYQKLIFSSFLQFCDFSCFWCPDLVEVCQVSRPICSKTPSKQRFSTILRAHFGPGAGKTLLSILSSAGQILIWGASQTRFWPFFIIFDLLATIFTAGEAL